jgi:RNA polymerase sigma factor (sigma-70 family)
MTLVTTMTAPPDQGLDVDHVAALLVAARDGRDGGYDRLIAVCRPVVERQARRSAWRAGDVDDIVQEVWIRLFENADKIREPHSLLAWLTMVTSRAASQVGRRGFRLVPTELDDSQPGPASTEDQAMRTYERRQVTDGVRAALGRLDAAERRVLLLLEGDRALSYREVSREVRRPIGSLGPTRQRLLRRLRVDPAVQRLRPAG